MSSINFHPTFEYSQPDEYRFSHDSVFFARWLFDQMVSHKIYAERALDVGAGCGIIALDFLYHLHKEAPELPPNQMDLLEIQHDAYLSHFRKNEISFQESLPLKTKLSWHSKNYKDFITQEKYDLIFSNPPYFFPNEGLLSPKEFKNRCRFFLDASFEDFIFCLERNLSPRGQAYFLYRDRSQDKGETLEKLMARLQLTHLNLSVCGEIRQTLILRLSSTSVSELGSPKVQAP